MKKQFSSKWTGSKQRRKQRKYRANAPLHLRHKMIAGNLSKELRQKYGKRSFPVRKGDKVKIMIGKFKKKTGKINEVDLKNSRVSIEGMQRQKRDGTKINVYFAPSNLQIQELSLDDKKREESLKGKNAEANKEIKKEEKAEVKKEKKKEEKKEKQGGKNVSEKK